MTTLDIAPAAAIEPKTKLSGKVLKITLAGALVDIGQSVPGVLHISQISESSVNKVEDVLKEGQEVTVWVKRVRNDRVELTMVEPLAYDWKELKPDMVVKGKVTRIETYGAFVDFGAERPGLIHVSELSHGFVKSAGAVVKQGDEVEAKVLEVDRRKRQIRLSVKALQEAIAAEEAPEPVERKPKGKRKGGKKSEESYEMEQETSNEPEFTAMQVAWQQALEKANGKTKIRANAPTLQRKAPTSYGKVHLALQRKVNFAVLRKVSYLIKSPFCNLRIALRVAAFQIILHERIQVAIQDGLGVADLKIGAVILDHLVGMQNIGADLTPPLGFSVFPAQHGAFLLFFGAFQFDEASAQDAHGELAVLRLGAFILARHHDPCGNMSQPNRSGVLLDVLPARAR